MSGRTPQLEGEARFERRAEGLVCEINLRAKVHQLLNQKSKNGDAKIFAQACVSCHSWTGISAISPFATISGGRAVNDPSATNVAQIVISDTQRSTPGAMSMPAFGSAYTDTEIAAVANYVTGRFGSAASKLTAKDVADLRGQTAR
jgi:mono/diheme cytochrome c family protein